jgi:hypothetical protein
MPQSSPAFSERYLAQVEAERQYVVQHLQEVDSGSSRLQNDLSSSSGIDAPLSATMNRMLTLEEAYRAVYATSRSSR